jgi:uncharacterized protein YicC (UPF0701 family)
LANDDRDDTSTVKRIVRATTGMTNIVVVGTAAVGAAALQSWPILALGGVAYGALVAWDLVSGKGKRGAPSAAAPAELSEDLSQYTDAQTQAAVRAILAARKAIDQTLAETPPEVQEHLDNALASVRELEDRAASLARRGEDVSRYLKTTDVRVVQADVDALARRVATANDPEAKAQYVAAHQARKEHLDVLRDLWNAKERIGATLLSIAATMEGLPAKIVRMRALDAQATDQLSGDVKEELDRMNTEIRSFEDTLKTIAEVAA